MKPIRISSRLGRILTGAALAAIVSLGSGCFVAAVGAAGAAGAGTVAWVRGELSATLPQHVGHVSDAADRAVDQLQLAKIKEDRDSLSAKIEVRTAEDKKVEIRLSRQPDDATKVNIRVGVFGDEGLSRAILEKIKSNLG
jgi:hypothetical protein